MLRGKIAYRNYTDKYTERTRTNTTIRTDYVMNRFKPQQNKRKQKSKGKSEKGTERNENETETKHKRNENRTEMERCKTSFLSQQSNRQTIV